MSDDGDFWREYNYEAPEGPPDALDPRVLARALGTSLASYEGVICAWFA